MAIYAKVSDEPSLGELSSRSSSGKPFEDEHLSFVSIGFSEARNVKGHAISLNHSIEGGLEMQNLEEKRLPRLPYCKIKTDHRKRRVVVAVLLGFLLMITILAIALSTRKRRTPSTSSANTRGEDVTSRFDTRGEGGGAGNSVSFDVNVFAGDDVVNSPFSTLDPVRDLDRYSYLRDTSSSPSARLDPLRNRNQEKALPTNAWYQNMLRLGIETEPTKDHRVYTIPYMIDAAGTFAGIRAHATRLEATTTQVRIAIDEPYALTLGATNDFNGNVSGGELDKGYFVHKATDLGLTLHWDSYMKTSLVRGSPYVTMIYNMSDPAVTAGILPTMHWRLDTSELPVADGNRAVDCESEPVFTVNHDLELAFLNSGQRWLLFFSRAVRLQCQDTRGSPTILQVLRDEDEYEDPTLVIRGALVVSSSSTDDDDESFFGVYANKLRAFADVYPGESTSVAHSFNDDKTSARISFQWDPQSMSASHDISLGQKQTILNPNNEMIMFALPHHQEILAPDVLSKLCTISLLGPVCLVEGNVWNMYEGLPFVDFLAPRHPDPKYIPVLAEALVKDIEYKIPSNFLSGAGDTYFSGKTIAKLARILLIHEEVKNLCTTEFSGRSDSDYAEVCKDLELPGDDQVEDALNQLREAVTVWVKTNVEAPFTYDEAWGGLVSCGCIYQAGNCTNQLPDCPAYTDQGLNFGNGFYNDHHFHYGYHVYAAAALAHFDSSWAIDHYEYVSLFVRDYANPSEEDEFFPVFRNKDWYRGHSWASGLTEPMFRNIMNQESSSEAVMAYEAVALFGKTMATIFQDAGDANMVSVAKRMHNIGLTLTATEIRSTQRYWQVQHSGDGSKDIFPELYAASVVGILWETSAEFTTWFGNAPYLIYGIQLLPLTAISEQLDRLEWAKEIYKPLIESCNGACVSEGWSIQVNGIMATIGLVQEAVEGILRVPSTAYQHAGGNGHSKSNALWYVSTRPRVARPSFGLDEALQGFLGEGKTDDNDSNIVENETSENGDNVYAEEFKLVSCFNPTKCTDNVLETDADGYSCRDRIVWLMGVMKRSEFQACQQVAVDEFPSACGMCQPVAP